MPFQSSLKLFLPQEKELLDNDDFELEKHGSSCLSEVERFYSLKTPIIIVKNKAGCFADFTYCNLFLERDSCGKRGTIVLHHYYVKVEPVASSTHLSMLGCS